MKSISPVTFIDKLVKKNELGQPFTLVDHQREVLRLAFAFDEDGRLPYDTILYSCIKKSGKTTLNGALTLAWGFTQEAANEILILANDLEQTLARVFRAMEGIIQHNPELQREAEVQSRDDLSYQRYHGHSDQRRLCRRRGFQSWVFVMG
jgi:phage terminase large subunit-like protein